MTFGPRKHLMVVKGRFAFSNPFAANTIVVENLAFEFIGWDIFLLLARFPEDFIEGAQKDSSELLNVKLQELTFSGRVFEEAYRILQTIVKKVVPVGNTGA